MEIDFLRHFGFNQNILSILEADFGKSLMPLQTRVIQEGGLFEQKNLVICGPTSSGKTMLSEIVMLWHALNMRKVVLLVPTKALANQRYEEINQRYSSSGFEICLSTRDHSQDDHNILTGKFHLSIVIYEKMQILSTIQPTWLSTLGCCIIDEFHYLFHPQRGVDLELLLTHLRDFQNMQLITLSSTTSPPMITQWLNATEITEEKRPIELHQGVLHQQRFTYISFNTQDQHSETLPIDDSPDEMELMLNAALHFANKNEINLLFFPRRELCYWAAKQLMKRLENDFNEVSEALNDIEPSVIRKLLAQVLPCRVAVHTSDLTAMERKRVEQLCQQGEILIICATSTLAEGLNFPVNNVFTTALGYQLEPGKQHSSTLPVPTLLDPAQLSNMIGRAGRKGYTNLGRGIILARSKADLEGLMRQFTNNSKDHQISQLPKSSQTNVILKIIAYHSEIDITQVISFLQSTYHGICTTNDHNLIKQTQKSIQQLLTQNFINQNHDKFYLTALGELVCKKGLHEKTALVIEQYLNEFDENTNFFSHITFIAFLDEMHQHYIPLSRNELIQFSWINELCNIIAENHFTLPVMIQTILSNKSALRIEHHRACKKVVLLYHWLMGVEITQIELVFRVYAGNIIRLSEDASWLLCCIKEAVDRFDKRDTLDHSLTTIQIHIQAGIPLEYPEWCQLVKQNRVTRRQALILIKNGIDSPEMIHQYDNEWLLKLCPDLPTDWLEQYQHRAKATKHQPQHPLVVGFNQNLPHKLYCEEHEILLTPTQSRLIACLAKSPNHCIEYDTLIKQVWPETISDRKQLLRQKQEIHKKMKQHFGTAYAEAIETIPGRGLALRAQVVKPEFIKAQQYPMNPH